MDYVASYMVLGRVELEDDTILKDYGILEGYYGSADAERELRKEAKIESGELQASGWEVWHMLENVSFGNSLESVTIRARKEDGDTIFRKTIILWIESCPIMR